MSDSEETSYEGLVRGLLTPIVDNADGVEVEEVRTGTSVVIGSRVHPQDMGRVIGKGGETIRALRTIVEFAGEMAGDQATLDMADA